MDVKYRRNITFLDIGKIVEFYRKDNTDLSGAQRVSPIKNNNNQPDTELSSKTSPTKIKQLAKVSRTAK